MNSRIFKSLNDRQNISNAYNSICESEDNASAEAPNSTSESNAEQKRAYNFICERYTSIPQDSISALDEVIGTMVGLENDHGEFNYEIEDDAIEFHVENDGIGSYEYWGHEEYDKGVNRAIVDGFTDEIAINVPPGTKLVFNDDAGRIEEMIEQHFSNHFDYADEDGHGTYSTFSAPLRYELVVTDGDAFSEYVETVADEHGIDLGEDVDGERKNATPAVESVGDGETGTESDASETETDGWSGRGKDVDWNYVDILKYTKSFMDIKKAVTDILYHKLWDMQFAEGENRKRVFDEARSLLETIDREAGRWAPNSLLPGYNEVIRDIERLGKLG